MKILIITDAWHPQVNGVVNTYNSILPFIEGEGHTYDVIHPYLQDFKRKTLSFYPEIQYVVNFSKIKEVLKEKIDSATFVHIATEGPLGFFARRYCVKRNLPFTTCFHSLFPEFIQKRWRIPTFLTYFYFRWFHKNSRLLFVPTNGIKEHLKKKGFDVNRIQIWTRGVDSSLFSFFKRNLNNEDYALCVSRISKEKGLDDFCKLNHPRKIVVGDGPYLEKLKEKYPDVIFLGKKVGEELASLYANAEVFVFPSKSDTFGIVILEAISSGTPVAAYRQPGPLEVIQNGVNGYVSDNLQLALEEAIECDRYDTYLSSGKWTWVSSAKQFIVSIEKISKTI